MLPETTWPRGCAIVPRPRRDAHREAAGRARRFPLAHSLAPSCRHRGRWRLSWPPARAPAPTTTSRGGRARWTGNAATTSTTLQLLAPWLLASAGRRPARRELPERLGQGESRPCAGGAARAWRSRRPTRRTAKATLARSLERMAIAASQRAGRRADHGDRQALAPLRRARAIWTRVPLRPCRHLLAIGYNVDERRLRRQLLRPARLRGAAGQLRRDRAGPACRRSTGSPRPAADHRRRRSRCCCRGAARCSST